MKNNAGIIDLTDENFRKEVLECLLPVLVIFDKDWYGTSILMKPVLSEIASQYVGQVKVGRINCDKHILIANKYHIQNVLTLLFFNKCTLEDKITGAVPKATIEKILRRLMDV